MGRVAVVGAGAAGLMAAIAAREHGADVTLVERTPDGGRKILVSGGGRCNVLPAEPAPARFVSEAPASTVRAMLGAWPLDQQRAYFENELGVALALEPSTGKYFPASNRARDVRDALVTRARALGVALRFGAMVTAVRPERRRWLVTTSDDVLEADAVIVATGGLSVPATGSTGFGFDVAAAAGHTVHPRYPALTPLTAAPHPHAELAGISLDVRITAVSDRERAASAGGFLFTHRGYSGPAVLDVSHVAVRSAEAGGPRAAVRVAWTSMDAAAWSSAFLDGRGTALNLVARHLPHRLAEMLLDAAGVIRERTCVQLRRDERARLVTALTAFELPWSGHEGYRPAEVTGGGVALDEVDRASLESRHAPGLHFCGEVLDAFGPIGGHNFQWAWSTGRTAGRGAARPSN
ncbi:MAG: aminoacetone oxidase family FAD-binding enzyme [Vicinamibacterales bacterium]